MATCFVIQPFDSGKFDKRFRDIYRPAIEAAGLEAYRVDQDPGVLVPIDAIEKGIQRASVCLADITTDNPNVWYELGFAFASERPVIMVCSNERTGKIYPFDIQHRTVVAYQADSSSDFDELKGILTNRIKSILKQDAVLEHIVESGLVTPFEGLTQTELIVLAVIAGEAYLPNQSVGAEFAKRSAERAGLTNMGFNLGLRRLLVKEYVREEQLWDPPSGENYPGLAIADIGWGWIDANEERFSLVRSDKKQSPDAGEDIPF